jgi:hypothetical protein
VTVPDPDDRLTAAGVANRLGKSVKSVRRWMREGVTVNGRRVRLASVKVGADRYTCPAWLSAFVAAQNPGGEPVPTPTERRKAADRARAELASILGGTS